MCISKHKFMYKYKTGLIYQMPTPLECQNPVAKVPAKFIRCDYVLYIIYSKADIAYTLCSVHGYYRKKTLSNHKKCMCQKHTISRFVHGNHPHYLLSDILCSVSLSLFLFLSPSIRLLFSACTMFNIKRSRIVSPIWLQLQSNVSSNALTLVHTTLLKRSRTESSAYTELLRIEQEFDVVTVRYRYTLCSIVYLLCYTAGHSFSPFLSFSLILSVQWYTISLRSKFI